MNVLIVENDEVVTRLWNRWLSTKHEVAIAFSVEEALVEIKNKMPDLVLLDLRLNGPTNSGMTVYEHIRNELKKDTPIIFVTGLEFNIDLFKQAEHRVDVDQARGVVTQMVQKPVSIRKLSELVDNTAVY